MGYRSPPSRAAWIEIAVAVQALHGAKSPPSRAAWIEMWLDSEGYFFMTVAAFTGGVD